MRGECKGKMRSTPSPCTMRRTVNVERPPSPRIEITTPVYTCTRSFCPSRMRRWTSTVSPIWKSSRWRVSSFSTSLPCLSFSFTLYLTIDSICWPSTRATNLFVMVGLLSYRIAPGRAAGQRLLAAPFGDGRVVAAEQDVGHRHAAELAGARVLRVLQPPGLAVRFLDDAFRVAEHTGHISDYSIDHDHRRHLAAVADEVADADLARPQPQADALVEALVPAA